MSTNIPDNSFILGTQDGVAIPLSAARAKYSRTVALTSASIDIVMPEEVNLVTIYATSGFKLTHKDSQLPVIPGWDTEVFRGIAGMFYDLLVPKNISLVKTDADGVLTINCLVRWAAISNEGKYLSS